MITQVRTSEQIRSVARLAGTIWREHYTPLIGAAQVTYMLERFQSEEAITRQLADANCRYYLMELEGEAVGYLGVELRGALLFLSKIYVLAAWRGKGCGKALARCAERVAEENGCRRIELTVNRGNLSSIAAYEGMGFERTGTRVAEIGGGFVMDDYVMEKRLLPAYSQR